MTIKEKLALMSDIMKANEKHVNEWIQEKEKAHGQDGSDQ